MEQSKARWIRFPKSVGANQRQKPMPEVQDIFEQYGTVYRQTHKLPLAQYKAMNAIQNCRTSRLGGHLDKCPNCGYEKPSYNSCRNRHCPKCQTFSKERWIDAQGRFAGCWLLSCRLYCSLETQSPNLPQPKGMLQASVPVCGGDASGARPRQKVSGSIDRTHCSSSYLGPESLLSSAHPLYRSIRRPDRTGQMAVLTEEVLPPGTGAVPQIPGKVFIIAEAANT
jgi:predicted Zn-ribbon and HTH transcriptional regulator